MKGKFAKINGTEALVNFMTKDDQVVMLTQKMDEDVEMVEVKQIQVSDLDSGTLIINNAICLQMAIDEAALIYTRFNLIR